MEARALGFAKGEARTQLLDQRSGTKEKDMENMENLQKSLNSKQNISDGKKLCLLSLFFMFIAPIIIFLIAGRFMNGDISGATAGAYSVMIPLDFISYIAAWVLAIISRARYKNKFSLVLIIIYALLLVLSIIGVIFFICVLSGLV